MHNNIHDINFELSQWFHYIIYMRQIEVELANKHKVVFELSTNGISAYIDDVLVDWDNPTDDEDLIDDLTEAIDMVNERGEQYALDPHLPISYAEFSSSLS